MDKMIEEGGLATDGMSVDPVSGNDIPTGSNAVDVRDDVEAKLSEGEYVVPADVVKYIGVSTLEKMVSKAKDGLGEMESEGRIGGAPVADSEAREEILEYTLGSDLGTLDGYATGGLVEGADVDGLIDRVKAAAVKDPSIVNMLKAKGIFIEEPQPQGVMQKQAMSSGKVPAQAAPPAVQGEPAPTGYAEGGMVYGQGEYNPSTYGSSYDPYAHVPGFSITGAAPNSSYQPPQAPSGDSGKSTNGRGFGGNGGGGTSCPPGYTWSAGQNMCVPFRDSRGEGDSSQITRGNPNAWMEKYDYSNPETLFESSMSRIGAGEASEEESGGFLSGLTGVAKSIFGGGIAGGLVGKFSATVNSAQVAANAIALREMGREDLADQLETANKAFVADRKIGMVPEAMRDGDRLANQVRDVQYGGSFSNAQPSSSSSSSSSGLASRPSAAPTSSARPVARPSNNDKDSGPNAASRAASDYQASVKSSDASSVHEYAQSTKAPQRSSNTGSGAGGVATQRDSVSAKDASDPRNMNKGGLVQPRKKK
jgi:hypothetical protein